MVTPCSAPHPEQNAEAQESSAASSASRPLNVPTEPLIPDQCRRNVIPKSLALMSLAHCSQINPPPTDRQAPGLQLARRRKNGRDLALVSGSSEASIPLAEADRSRCSAPMCD